MPKNHTDTVTQQSPSTAVTRRKFMGFMGLGGAATATGIAGCQSGVTVPDTTPPDMTPPVLTDDLKIRLLNRTTFGPSQAEVEAIDSLGFQAYLEQQLDPDTIDDGELDRFLSQFPTLNMSTEQLLEQEEEEDVARELIIARLARAVLSRKQLFERVVDFWTDHFSIYQAADFIFFLKTVDDRDVIRANALGNFRDMLHASARSGAMLIYLDNAVNIAEAPNENYARELLELHTLGVDGGYTQRDVEEVARALTGWSLSDDEEEGPVGKFIFRPEEHDDNAKTIMTLSLPPNGGIEDGNQVLDFLANHPNTARFLARKLVRHFISEDEPTDVVDRVTQAFIDNDMEIKPALRELFSETSLQAATSKMKRPMHLTVDVIRRTGTEIQRDENIGDWLELMGHLPYRWPAPNGYPDSPGFWGPGLLNRWNYIFEFALGDVGTAPFEAEDFARDQAATTRDEVLELWSRTFFSGQMPEQLRQQVASYIDDDPNDSFRLYYESLVLALSAPDFQWH